MPSGNSASEFLDRPWLARSRRTRFEHIQKILVEYQVPRYKGVTEEI
jgi:hypothetical protein